MATIDKKQKRWYSKSTFDSLDKTTIPVGTEIQVAGELGQADFDSDTNTKLNAVPNKLDKPGGNPTEDSLVKVSSTGSVSWKKISDFFSESGLIKYESVTIPWANVATNGFTDTVRVVNQGINEHSLYIRLTYNDWQTEVFLTVISTESNSVTSLDTLLGDTYYHEASGTIHKVADESNFYLGQIQNVSHNGVKVLIPVITL